MVEKLVRQRNPTLVQGVHDYPQFAGVSFILMVFTLFWLYPMLIAPMQEYNHVMSSDGMTQLVTIETSSWDRVSFSRSVEYDNHVTFSFHTQGSTVVGNETRTVSSKDNVWQEGKQVTLHYLNASQYELEGSDRPSNSAGPLLICFLGALFLSAAMMPFFCACPRDDNERAMLGENNSKNKSRTSSDDLKPEVPWVRSYAEVQMSMRDRGSLDSMILTFGGIALTAFLYLSTVFFFGLEQRDAAIYGIGTIASASVAIGFFLLSGVYLRRGKHAESYAYVLRVNDQIRSYRRKKLDAR